jgi:hypothetical protein
MNSGCSRYIYYQTGGEVVNRNYSTRVPCIENPFGYRIVNAVVNGDSARFLFDTGAEISDVSIKAVEHSTGANVIDYYGNSTILKIGKDIEFLIGDIIHHGLFGSKTMKNELFSAYDYILGNNVIAKHNILIEKDSLSFSDKEFGVSKLCYKAKLYLPGDYRYRMKIYLNDFLMYPVIDYGSSISFDIPEVLYHQIKGIVNVKREYSIVSAGLGVSGLSQADTVVRMMCDVNINGFAMSNVNLQFSSTPEVRIGVEFLNRFNTVAINNKSNKILLGDYDTNYISRSKNLPVAFYYLGNELIVGGKEMDNQTVRNLNVCDTIISINSKTKDDFVTFEDFWEYQSGLMQNDTIVIQDNKGTIHVVY